MEQVDIERQGMSSPTSRQLDSRQRNGEKVTDTEAVKKESDLLLHNGTNGELSWW